MRTDEVSREQMKKKKKLLFVVAFKEPKRDWFACGNRNRIGCIRTSQSDFSSFFIFAFSIFLSFSISFVFVYKSRFNRQCFFPFQFIFYVSVSIVGVYKINYKFVRFSKIMFQYADKRIVNATQTRRREWKKWKKNEKEINIFVLANVCDTQEIQNRMCMLVFFPFFRVLTMPNGLIEK